MQRVSGSTTSGTTAPIFSPAPAAGVRHRQAPPRGASTTRTTGSPKPAAPPTTRMHDATTAEWRPRLSLNLKSTSTPRGRTGIEWVLPKPSRLDGQMRAVEHESQTSTVKP